MQRTEHKDLSFKLSFEVKTHILEIIKLADYKATGILAVSTATLVYILGTTLITTVELFASKTTVELAKITSFILILVFLISSSFLSFYCIRPRTKYTHQGGIFYGTIVQWRNSADYAAYVNSLSVDQAITESSSHNFDLSVVAQEKVSSVKYSIDSFLIGQVFTASYLLIRWATSS